MTVRITVAAADGDRWPVTIESPAGTVHRTMPLVRDDTDSSWPVPAPGADPAELVALTTSVDSRTAGENGGRRYGQLLFDALLGSTGRPAVAPSAGASELLLELDFADLTLHRFVWELLHDGTAHLAARPTTPVVVVRLLGSDDPPAPITSVPKVLFAIGSSLQDPRVRAGAEVMGVLRDMEYRRPSSSEVSVRVLVPAEEQTLARQSEQFRPHIIHLIGHGHYDPTTGGRLTLTGDNGVGERSVTGSRLADLVAPAQPRLVILSACDTAVARSPAGPPLAAELVQNGVPFVVAMAGEISDPACRLFSRALAAAVGRGLPLVRAMRDGRRASFGGAATGAASLDWALPALYTSARITASYSIVDGTAGEQLSQLLIDYDLVVPPIFAGRNDLFDDLDRTLSNAGTPASLVLFSRDTRHVGGTRTLRELAAEAMRRGHLPILVPHFKGAADSPDTFERLALVIAQQCGVVADRHGLDRPGATITVLFGDPVPDDTAIEDAGAGTAPLVRRADKQLIEAIRSDVATLHAAMCAVAPDIFGSDKRPVLFLDDLHLYDQGLPRLLRNLQPSGLGHTPRDTALLTVVYGNLGAAGSEHLDELVRQVALGSNRMALYELVHIADCPPEVRQSAYLSWLLHPPTFFNHQKLLVAAPTNPDDTGWVEFFDRLLERAPYYDFWAHDLTLRWGVKYHLLTPSDDDAQLLAVGLLP